MSHWDDDDDEEGMNAEDLRMKKLLEAWDQDEDGSGSDNEVLKKKDSDASDAEDSSESEDDEPKAKAAASDSDDDDSDDDDDEDEKPKPKAAADSSDEESSDDEDETPKPKAAAADSDSDEESKAEEESDEDSDDDKPKKKAAASDSDSDDDDEDSEDDKPKKKAAASDSDSDDDEDSDDDKPKKKAAAADSDSDDSDDSDDEPVAKKKSKADSSDSDSDDDSDEEDAKMKQLLNKWDDDGGKKAKASSDSDDSDSSDDSDDSDDEGAPAKPKKKRDVVLDPNRLDHIVLATADLEKAMKTFEKMTGIEPSVGGTHRGLGTKSARVALSDNTYLELLGPDPKSKGPIGEDLKRMLKEDELVPFHYAIRTDKITEYKDKLAAKYGFEPDHISMFGAKTDGTPRKWEMIIYHNHELGGLVPIHIDWADCEHPCCTLPMIAEMEEFTISVPEDHKCLKLVDDVEGVDFEEGEPDFKLVISCPKGSITFQKSDPAGLKFPGFEPSSAKKAASDDDLDDEFVVAPTPDFKFPDMPDLLPTS